MRRLRLTRKRTLRAAEQDEAAIRAERRAGPEAIASIAVERFVLIDASAALTNLVRLDGWSACGARALGMAPSMVPAEVS